MRMNTLRLLVTGLALACLPASSTWAGKTIVLDPIDERFNSEEVQETPSFQRHVVPLFGRLGCNSRSCHGSFQGQGGFQLSLFGYDFKADHAALFDEESPRVDPRDPLESLIIAKPTDEDYHEGGQRYEPGSWQYQVIRRWIESGAEYGESDFTQMERLEITPSEIIFSAEGEQVQLKAVAIWEDGTREDVTPLCRFQSNSSQVCSIDENGLATGKESGDSHIVVFYDNGVVPIPVMRPVTDQNGDHFPAVSTPTRIDELVVEKLRKLGIVPSDICSDTEFLRRVRLDLTGTLPTADEVIEFVVEKGADKRSKKIDALLETPEYAAWWTTKLCDYTGNNDQQLTNVLPNMKQMRTPASKAWYDWIYRRVEQNMPYDDLVEGMVTSQSLREGQSYREYCEEMCDVYRGEGDKSFADFESMPFYWSRRDFRNAEPRAINFAYAFMGIRIQCAQCHKHPFDQWSKEDFAQFQGFFGTTQTASNRPPGEFKKEYDEIVAALDLDKKLNGGQLRREYSAKLEEGKIVPFNVVYVNNRAYQTRAKNSKGKGNAGPTAKLLGDEIVSMADHADIREPLMEWLRRKENPYFAKAFVNRVWASYFNRGIVSPPDDMSLANPPTNTPLLEYLASGFYESGFDMKWVHRTILNSETYQRSWKPNETNVKDETNFSHAIARRMPAEVVYDAIVQATASDDKIAQLRNDHSGRAIAIPGSNGQNRNYAGNASFALTVFGRSTRESNCDCDRAMDPSLLQTVFLRNDRDMLNLLDDNNSWIAHLAREYKPKIEKPARQLKRPGNYDQTIANMEKVIERAKKGNANTRKIKDLQRRLASYKARFKDAIVEPVEVPKVAPGFSSTEIIKQAYLRSVSRLPDEEELARCEAYVADSEDPIDAVRDVLWALINTKEFVVNH